MKKSPRAFTLIEVMIATVVTTMIAGTVVALIQGFVSALTIQDLRSEGEFAIVSAMLSGF